MSKLSTARRFPFTTSSDRLQNGYAAVEIQEGFNQLYSIITELKDEVNLLRKHHSEMLLQKLNQSSKEYLTIEEVEALFDISKRTQQEERSAGKLCYLKKKDGNKVLYTHEHLRNYLNDHYELMTLTK